MSKSNLAKIFLNSQLLQTKSQFSGPEIDQLVHTENYGESPRNHVEIFTKATNTVPPREVKLIVFPDGSAAAFKQCVESVLFDKPKPGSVTSLKDAIRASHKMFDSSNNPSHIYKNSDGANVVVSDSPTKSKKSNGAKASKNGGGVNTKKRQRRRRTLGRKSRRTLTR